MIAWTLVFAGSLLGANPPAINSSATDPATLREAGLRGLIYDQGRWVTPDEVVDRTLEDDRLRTTRALYQAKRAKAPGTSEGQRELALWCEREGLKSESLAHFMVVTRLDPDDFDARRRLGQRLHRGEWRSEVEIAAEAIEADAQAKADRAWAPKLAAWRRQLNQPEHRSGAIKELGEVHDPRAVSAVRREFGDRGTWEQDWAVKLLGQIDAPRSSQVLAELSVYGLDEKVRASATRNLVRRDPRTFVGLLINWLRQPLRYEMLQDGAKGLLRLESPTAILERAYIPTPKGGTPAASPALRANGRVEPGMREAILDEQKFDALKINRANFAIERTNLRIEKTLQAVTGLDLGTDPQPWASWWTGELGYTYESPKAEPKPVIQQTVGVAYVSPPAPIVVPTPLLTSNGFQPLHHSCFGAGTPVLTRVGPRPIEDLRVGDQVLSQDQATGELIFRPILAVFHNKPAATLRVALEGETVVATGIHRFWKAGQGWSMARDLKPGDKVRTVGGQAEVISVDRDEVQPVYNLEVADGHSFFVGRHRTLVHDNSLVAPTPSPFDAAPALARASGH